MKTKPTVVVGFGKVHTVLHTSKTHTRRHRTSRNVFQQGFTELWRSLCCFIIRNHIRISFLTDPSNSAREITPLLGKKGVERGGGNYRDHVLGSTRRKHHRKQSEGRLACSLRKIPFKAPAVLHHQYLAPHQNLCCLIPLHCKSFEK